MSIVEPGSAGAGLIARVKAILTQPAPTWDVIETERPTPASLYMGYVLPLAAIGPICQTIGMTVFGVGAFGFSYKPPILWSVTQGVVSFVLALAMVFVMTLIIEGLAPNFGGTKDREQALKVAAYAPTAAWIAGVFGLFPMLGILAVLGGLYSLYLLYLGLPKLMKVPQERAGGYFGVVLVVAIVVSIVIFMVTGSIMTAGRMASGGALGAISGPGKVSGTINVPGQGSVDLGKLEAAAKAMESGKSAPATDPELLKAYLPASIGGFTRSELSTGSGGMAGVQGSSAEGRYEKGDARLTVGVVDMGSAGALASMAGAFNVKSSKESATSYERVGKVDGRLTQESFDSSTKHGEYSVMVGDRFMVHAEGDGVTMDELKAAVAAVGIGKLEGLAKAG